MKRKIAGKKFLTLLENTVTFYAKGRWYEMQVDSAAMVKLRAWMKETEKHGAEDEEVE